MTEQNTVEGWAIVELMGHGRTAGYVGEQVIAGAAFVRVDVPEVEGMDGHTRFYAPGAIFSILPVAENVARAVAARVCSPPVQSWDLPRLPPVGTVAIGQFGVIGTGEVPPVVPEDYVDDPEDDE